MVFCSTRSTHNNLIVVDHFHFHHHHRIKSVCFRTRSKGKIVVVRLMAKGDREMMLTSGASGRVNALLSMRALRSLLIVINAVLLLLVLPFRKQQRRRTNCLASSDSSSSNSEVEKQKGVPVVRVPWRWGGGGGFPAAERRTIAIKGVKNAGDFCLREFEMIVSSRGDAIFTRSWTPAHRKFRGLVVLLHGLNEHSGRYDEFAKQLNVNGYKVYGMDWIGHGGSDGLHAYVHSLDDAVADLKLFMGKVLAENPGLPCFCFGHSTGGAIVLKAALDPNIESNIAGIVLTSPAVGVQPSHPIFTVLAPIFSFLMPRYQFSAANKKGMPVSRDPEALVAKYSDPLVYTGSIRIRTGYEILRTASYLQQNLGSLKVPFLVLHGTADTVTDPNASQKLYEEASSDDKTIKLLQGLLHDLLFEPERNEITKGIVEWLSMRTRAALQ